jgi:uncharacterized protein YbaP (TraB family)
MNRKQKIEFLKGIMAGKTVEDLSGPMIKVWVESDDGLTISNGDRTIPMEEFNRRYGKTCIRVRVPEGDV